MLLMELVIFDIDSTLLRPNLYTTPESVRAGLYDPTVLIPFLQNPNIQVAIASFNQSIGHWGIIAGHNLGRTILDLQIPGGYSKSVVGDDFIQCWQYPTMESMLTLGKTEHIRRILIAFWAKWKCNPKRIVFYDDQPENIWLATQTGIKGYWVPFGLTRTTINTLEGFSTKIVFTCETNLYKCDAITEYYPYIKKYEYEGPYYFYLPENNSETIWGNFLENLKLCFIEITIISK